MTFKKDWEALYGHSPADFDKMVDAGRRIAELERDLAEARDEVERFHQEAQESATLTGKALRELEQARSNALAYLANQGNLNLELTRERDAARAELTEARELLHTIWHGTVNAPDRERWLRLMSAPAAAPQPDACLGAPLCSRGCCGLKAAGAGDGEQDTATTERAA